MESISQARDLHVDPITGDDGHNGITSPVKSIRQAVKIATAGDTIHLKPTVYYDYAGFYSKQGEPETPITLDGHGATLEGSETLDLTTWTESAPDLYRCDSLMPNLNRAILARWFFLFDGKLERMGRVLKGKSEPFRKPEELQPGEWTFVEEPKTDSPADSPVLSGAFYIKLTENQTLAEANIRYPLRSAGVQFSGDNAHLIIRNLTATHVYNDGFNIHGDCRNVVFENIRAIECGDDGISAHESAEYRVDGLVSIGNGTGICDTGTSQTSYKNVFIADCIGVDLYFLDSGRYSIRNAVVLSSAQKPMIVIGRTTGNCIFAMDNVYLRRVGPPEPALFAMNSDVTAKRLTLDNLNLRVTGEATFDSCLIDGDPRPVEAKRPGADIEALTKTLVPRTHQQHFLEQ